MGKKVMTDYAVCGYGRHDTEVSGRLMEGRIRKPADSTIARYVDLMSDTGFKLVFGTEAN